MNMTKKKVFVAALAISLVAIISMGTLAWFNASDELTNKFMIADSDGDGTPDFKVDVFETNPDTGDKDQDGITYDAIAPGDILDKDPTVYNLGDYDQWIRVSVTFDEWNTINDACVNQGITNDLRTWFRLSFNSSEWIAADNETAYVGDTVTYVYYLNHKLEPGKSAVLFENVFIPGEFEQDDMTFASNDFSINIKAEALQADNTGDNAMDAFFKYWGK